MLCTDARWLTGSDERVNSGTWQALELLINGNASMDIPAGNLLRTNHLGHNALQLARNSQNAYRKKVLAIMEKGTSFAFHPSSKPTVALKSNASSVRPGETNSNHACP